MSSPLGFHVCKHDRLRSLKLVTGPTIDLQSLAKLSPCCARARGDVLNALSLSLTLSARKFQITRKRTRNTTPRVRVLRKYRIPRSSCGLGFDALFTLSTTKSKMQPDASWVVGVVRRVLQRGGHQRKRPARAPTFRPPAHATRQKRANRAKPNYAALSNGPLRPPGTRTGVFL